MKPRYGVVVHRTPTDEVLLSENRERSMAKGFRIEEIAWLKKRDSALGAACVAWDIVRQPRGSRVGGTGRPTLWTEICGQC